MSKKGQAGAAIERLEDRRRALAAAVDGLERLGARQLGLVLRQTGRTLAERSTSSSLLLILAGPGLRAEVVDRLLRRAACDENRSVFYVAALGTLDPELVRAELPALIDTVVTGKVEPDYAHLLRLLWSFQDYPQLIRLIRYAKSEASEYDRQTLTDFLEDYEPDDLLDRIQPWWKDSAPASQGLDEGSTKGREPDAAARQAWTAFAAAHAQRRADVEEALEIGWPLLVQAARERHDDQALAHLVLLPQTRRHLSVTLRQLGADVEERILPVLLEEIGLDVTLTARGVIQDALAAAGFAEAARQVREVERERIGVYDDGHFFVAPRSSD